MQTPYRADIDGLRAIAVLSVVAFHAALPPFSGGFVGVDIFFVISGYLIGGIVEREAREGRFSFAGFYARRARRLLPALAAMLVFSYAATVLLLAPAETRLFAKNALASVFAVSNIVFWNAGGYFGPTPEHNPLLMTWSLGIEEQFYLFFPPLLILLLRRCARHLFKVLCSLTLVSLTLSIWGTHHASANFYLLPPRAWELGVGILLVLRPPRRLPQALVEGLGMAGLALILVPIFSYDEFTPFPGLAAVPPVLGSALLIAVPQSRINRLLLASRPTVLLGLISYSWYLWHWPLLAFARISAVHELGPKTGLALALLSALVGYLSWRFVEQPFRRGQAQASVVVRRACAALLLMAAPAAAMAATGGWPQRFNAVVPRLESQEERLVRDVCLVRYGARDPNGSPFCMPPNDGRPAMAILGDSHAAALSTGLRVLAEQNGRRFLQLTATSCPSIAGLSRYLPDLPSHLANCAEFSRRAEDLVMSDPSIKIVVLAGYWSAPFARDKAGQRFVLDGVAAETVTPAESRENLIHALDAMIYRLEAAGKRVLLIKDVPLFAFNPMDRRITDYIPVRHWLFERFAESDSLDPSTAPRTALQEDDADLLIEQVAASHPATMLIDAKAALCADGRCRFADDRDAFYMDNQHLTTAGARFVSAAIRLDLQAAQNGSATPAAVP